MGSTPGVFILIFFLLLSSYLKKKTSCFLFELKKAKCLVHEMSQREEGPSRLSLQVTTLKYV